MALANMRDLLRQADAQKRAVGAFNVSTIEMMCGVVKAAEELQTPVILQVAQIRLATTPLPLLGRAMYEAASRAKVPVALHLDHGTTMDCIQRRFPGGAAAQACPADEQGLAGRHISLVHIVRMQHQVRHAFPVHEYARLGRR